MVVIWVVLAVLLVQLLCQLLIRMRLNTESFTYREDFEEKWKFVTKSRGDVLGKEGLVVLYEVEEGAFREEVF